MPKQKKATTLNLPDLQKPKMPELDPLFEIQQKIKAINFTFKTIIDMKTNVQNRVTNGMFLLNNNYSTTAIYANAFQQETQSQAVMIESMIETIVEPIIFKC